MILVRSTPLPVMTGRSREERTKEEISTEKAERWEETAIYIPSVTEFVSYQAENGKNKAAQN